MIVNRKMSFTTLIFVIFSKSNGWGLRLREPDFMVQHFLIKLGECFS